MSKTSSLLQCNVYKLLKTNLNKSVDGHDSHVWLRFSIVHEIQVDQFLQLQVICLHAVYYIGEQR